VKITILQGAFFPVPPVLGGAVEKLWYGLGREFARFGHEVTHVSRSHPGFSEEEMDGGVRYLRVCGEESSNNLLLLKFRDLRYTLRAIRVIPDADILVSNTFWLPMIANNPAKGKIIVSVELMPKGQMRFYPRASLFRACSTVVASAVCKELPPGDQRVRMIPNPLPLAIEASIDFSLKQPMILYTGRIHTKKGLDLLVSSAAKLPSPWKVVIVGPYQESQGGGGYSYLSKLRQLAAGSPVEFHEPIFDAEKLSDFYKKAAVFVYPTVAENGEAMPIAPLEAMAWGCVPVVPRMECFKDYIHENVNGLYFDHRANSPTNELSVILNSIISDRQRCRELATQAQEVRSSHSLERISGALLELFSTFIPSAQTL